MKKEPFIINITDIEPLNLADNSQDDFGFEYNHTNVWRDGNGPVLQMLDAINEKLDMIIRHITINGRE